MTVIDDFLKDTPAPQRKVLEHVRSVAKQMIPEAEETISYGIPVLKHKGKYVIGFAPYTKHLSLFPGSLPVEVLKDKLKTYKTTKGTIQFSLEKPVPDDLLRDIIAISLDVATRR